MAVRNAVRQSALALALLLAWGAPAAAHPGVGIVMDRRGNIFYTDLTHVWKIAPDGTRSIAVRAVHTHELFLDARDTLHGEHLWYANNRWFHYTWRLTANGTLTRSATQQGFRQHESFVRDGAGRMYWFEAGPPAAIVRRGTGSGEIRLAEGRTRDVRWMTAHPDGTVYFTDDGDLRLLDPDGRVATLSPRVRENPDHWVGGIWLDAARRVHVAIWGARQVKRYDPASGSTQVIARSSAPWAPSGGLVAPDGALWLLETADDNSVRVRRLSPDGSERVIR